MKSEQIQFIKITDPNNVNSNLLTTYMDSIISECKCYGNLYSESHSVIFSTINDDELKIFLNRFLEDFETNGENSEELIDIYGLDVYISDPELSIFFMNRRMNILRNHNEILSDIILQTFNECRNDHDNLQKQVQTIDAVNQYNGIHKFRKIITVIVKALEDNSNIFLADKINEIVKETTH